MCCFVHHLTSPLAVQMVNTMSVLPAYTCRSSSRYEGRRGGVYVSEEEEGGGESKEGRKGRGGEEVNQCVQG